MTTGNGTHKHSVRRNLKGCKGSVGNRRCNKPIRWEPALCYDCRLAWFKSRGLELPREDAGE